jgi:imidazoleglycerol phosphate dehydratase HisB
MPILKAESKRLGYKYVGVSVSSWVFEYLTLYTLAKGTTKAKMYKVLIELWIKNHRAEEDDTVLIKEIVQRLNNQRKIDRANKVIIPLDKYKKEAEKELLEKGLKNSYVQLIIADLEE